MILNLLQGAAAIVLHEVAHAVAALCLGVKVKRAGISWRGAYIVREQGSDWQNIVISLAGPLGNLLLAVVAAFVVHHGAVFCASNLLLMGINLLPLPGTDGMRAYHLLWKNVKAVSWQQNFGLTR
jgi:Zn-dependent protease